MFSRPWSAYKKSPTSALALAAEAGSIEVRHRFRRHVLVCFGQVVELLVECRASLNSTGALRAAGLAGRWPAVRRLIELQADPDCSELLLSAVRAGDQDMVTLLCSRKASPNALSEAGSACAVAAAAGLLPVLQTLASARADLDQAGLNGNVFLHFASPHVARICTLPGCSDQALGSSATAGQLLMKEAQSKLGSEPGCDF